MAFTQYVSRIALRTEATIRKLVTSAGPALGPADLAVGGDAGLDAELEAGLDAGAAEAVATGAALDRELAEPSGVDPQATSIWPANPRAAPVITALTTICMLQ